MKRLLFSILPMILLILSIVLVFFVETIFMDQIIDLFNLSGASSLNTFNKYLIYFLGILSVYILSKYIMEINERIFRTFTFVLNIIGIIIIITILISGQFLMWM